MNLNKFLLDSKDFTTKETLKVSFFPTKYPVHRHLLDPQNLPFLQNHPDWCPRSKENGKLKNFAKQIQHSMLIY